MNQYDCVKLKTNRFKNEGLSEGDIGYIIEVYSDGNMEVEFSNPLTGETIAMVVAQPSELEPA
ncbi:DUF4926 domain-containing protein [Sulfoacidibacillus thermotolerans]|uniref:DUF4926 domain-containing protein n=1 Tax=Sulfoacidibacillus thermotolerans TaxID=1765684 RepID=A0A2U3D935_SULT2|nr:DUF4926 domain-containing protein [Sulfoacidibacillus thermotolerans]PWI57775.1 hypothetical protein BM613_07285 [Sulfoacidibacillus thermotolerans]